MKEKQLKNKRKKKPGAAWLAMLLSLGMAAGSFLWPWQGAEVMASEERIQVWALSVAAAGDGICARCFYQNFDNSTCQVQLYLEKQNGAETVPVVYRNLSETGGEGRREETEICREGTGIYRAVLLTRTQDETALVRFQDSGWYEAVDMGDHYEVRPYLPGSEENVFWQGEGAAPEENTWDACPHQPVRELYEPATPQKDAVFCESCELCGQVLAYGEIPNTAYAAFLDYAAQIVYRTPQGEEAVITTDRWISFDGRVLDAISARRDIPILIRYRDQGKEHRILLPAGADVGSLKDENGFCGFRYLNQIFGEKIDE